MDKHKAAARHSTPHTTQNTPRLAVTEGKPKTFKPHQCEADLFPNRTHFKEFYSFYTAAVCGKILI